MPETTPETDHPPAGPIHADVRRERTDANVKGIVWFCVGLGVAAVIIHVGLGWLFARFKSRELSDKPPLPEAMQKERDRQRRELIPPLENDPRREMHVATPPLRRAIGEPRRGEHEPPSLPSQAGKKRGDSQLGRDQQWQPRLQTDPVEDLKDLRAKEEEQLNRYGWVDKKTGRIPLEQAMRLLSDPAKASGLGIRVRPQKSGGKKR